MPHGSPPTLRGDGQSCRTPLMRSLQALDWLNFILADVQSGLGPFLAGFAALPIRGILFSLSHDPLR